MPTEVPAELSLLLGVIMVVYVAVMFGISALAQRQVTTTEDFVVAGRRLSFPLATATLLATWFGAGTLMTATDEVRARGLTAATLDPIGAGLCLLMVGAFFAAPLWKAKLITLPELFGRRYDGKTQVFSAALMIPPYLGWIAAQFLALAGILELFFGLPLTWGVLLVAAVGMGYTLMGGMWAVTLTDAVQIVLIIVGLGILAVSVLEHMGEGSAAIGFAALLSHTPPDSLVVIPTDKIGPFFGWTGVLLAGSLGNIPSQDVMQRVFSARSARVAQWSCAASGVLYLVLGAVPVMLGMAGGVLLPESFQGGTLAALASLFMSPIMAVVFLLTLLSAVLSTIDSALLAPGTVLARDLLMRIPNHQIGELKLVRISILVIGLLSLAFAFMGESAYALLESGYELGMVSLMAPLTFAVYGKTRSRKAALASMLVGTVVWLAHAAFGWEDFLAIEGFWFPVGLVCTALSFAAYPVTVLLMPEPEPDDKEFVRS